MPIVTLTTDFGTRDSYVAEMKGVILGLAPGVQIVDVTHEIAAHDVLEGALVLEGAVRSFPGGTIHVAVVDPGVGTARRGLVLRSGGQMFVGPDNGLFTPFLVGSGWEAFELEAEQYRRRPVSPTFHGRDVFAPAAAHLALRVAPRRFGGAVSDPVRLPWSAARRVGRGFAGTVVHVDRFGNLVTSIPASALEAVGRPAVVRVGGQVLPVVSTYGDLPPRGRGALVGSNGRIELVVREGRAAAALGGRRGTPVRLEPGSAGRGASRGGVVRGATRGGAGRRGGGGRRS